MIRTTRRRPLPPRIRTPGWGGVCLHDDQMALDPTDAPDHVVSGTSITTLPDTDIRLHASAGATPTLGAMTPDAIQTP